jgi:long-chain acyl-CoA synthetase
VYLTQGLHRALQQRPNAVATLCGERRRSFAELGSRVSRLAGALQQMGVAPGDRVAMLSLNSDCYLEYFLAVFWMGGVINPVNVRWSDAEITFSLNDCEATVLFVDDYFLPTAERIRSQCSTVRHFVHAGVQATPMDMLNYETVVDEASPVADVHRHGDDLAALFYTGGTTGFPKGVMLSHTNLWASSLSFLADELLRPGAIFLHSAPMFHAADFAHTVGQVMRGGTHVFIPSFNPVALMEAVARHRVTDLLLVPTMLLMLIDHPRLREFDLSSVRRIAFGAAPITETVLERALQALPGVEFMQAYGMTEAAPLITLNPPESYRPGGSMPGKTMSAGRASYAMDVAIYDSEDRELPRNTIGEVVVRGPNVMQGYWKRPQETAEALRGGWLHTGDAGYMDEDGYVFIVDRIKDMIISGGENIYSTEVENAIAAHPAVASCAVIGIPNEQWGELVHAVLVLKPGVAATQDDIVAHCRTLIAGYKCPRSMEFRDSLPLSGAGKLLKHVLREPYRKAKT